MAKNAYDSNIEARIENMWRVHKNRTDKGLGATWRSNGHHESMQQDFNFLNLSNSSVVCIGKSSISLWKLG